MLNSFTAKRRNHVKLANHKNPLLQVVSTNPMMTLLPLLPCSEEILQTCIIPEGSWHLLSALLTVLTLLVSAWTFRCLIWILTSLKWTRGHKWTYCYVLLHLPNCRSQESLARSVVTSITNWDVAIFTDKKKVTNKAAISWIFVACDNIHDLENWYMKVKTFQL